MHLFEAAWTFVSVGCVWLSTTVRHNAAKVKCNYTSSPPSVHHHHHHHHYDLFNSYYSTHPKNLQFHVAAVCSNFLCDFCRKFYDAVIRCCQIWVLVWYTFKICELVIIEINILSTQMLSDTETKSWQMCDTNLQSTRQKSLNPITPCTEYFSERKIKQLSQDTVWSVRQIILH